MVSFPASRPPKPLEPPFSACSLDVYDVSCYDVYDDTKGGLNLARRNWSRTTNKTRNQSVRVSHEMAAAIDTYALRCGVDRSTVIRWALEKYLPEDCFELYADEYEDEGRTQEV